MNNLSLDLPNTKGHVRRQLLKPASRREVLTAIRDVFTSRPEKKTEVPEPIERSGRSLRILLADDAAVNRMVAQSLLERRGHVVVTAADGQEAVEKWSKGEFDVVLMDIQMPKLDGFAATREIRNAENRLGVRIPIIAMTAHAMQGDRERCLEKGMDGYLSKPFRPEEMFELVETIGAERLMQRSARSEAKPAEGGQLKATAARHDDDLQAPDLPESIELDYDMLLSNTGNDYELAQQMIGLFLEESTSQLDALRQAVQARDGNAIAKGSHLLRGSVSIFGAAQCVDLLRKLEASGKSEQFDKVDSQWTDLLKATETLLFELRTAEPIPETADSRYK